MSLPPNWTRYYTAEGKEYYHNSISGVTTWEKPANTNTPPAVIGLPVDMNADLGRLVLNDYAVSTSTAEESGKLDLEKGDVSSGRTLLAEDNSQPAKVLWCIDLAWLQSFFDVSSDEVIKRLFLALIPFKSIGSTETDLDFRKKPDLWGPFWIATTAIFCFFVTGNVSSMLTPHVTSAHMILATVASSIVYSALIGVPSAAYALLYFTGHAELASLVELICIYGYSLFVLIPVSILCIIPSTMVRWISIAVGLFISLTFLFVNFYKGLESSRYKWILIAGVCGIQAALFLTFRLYFYYV